MRTIVIMRSHHRAWYDLWSYTDRSVANRYVAAANSIADLLLTLRTEIEHEIHNHHHPQGTAQRHV